MSWSFIICTDGGPKSKNHEEICLSIEAQNIPEYEIIFATEDKKYCETSPVKNKKNVKILHVPCSLASQITKKKNVAAGLSKYENLCFLHDYIILGPEWYKSFETFGYTQWNVCVTPLVYKNTGNRTWDWCVASHPTLRHTNVPYEMPASKWHYAPGNYFCAKRKFFLENPLDETLVWGQEEDIKWSHKLSEVMNYHLNPNGKALSLK